MTRSHYHPTLASKILVWLSTKTCYSTHSSKRHTFFIYAIVKMYALPKSEKFYLSKIQKLIHAFITWQLDYCNALLSRCSNNSIESFQLILAYKALNSLAPNYLRELDVPYCPPRPLHSQNAGVLVIPIMSKSSIGGRAFCYQAPLLSEKWTPFPSLHRD